MITFPLKSRFTHCPDAEIQKARYPNGSTAWNVMGDCGEGYPEALGTPTVALDTVPPPGHVYIKVTDEHAGWLESLMEAGIVEDTGVRLGAGYVREYAAVCRVLKPELQ